MDRSDRAGIRNIFSAAVILFALTAPSLSKAADYMVGIHSARVMSQSMPWMAQEAGLFKKYNIDFNLVFISSSSIVTAALLGGEYDRVHWTMNPLECRGLRGNATRTCIASRC